MTPPGIRAESNPVESFSPNARPERWIGHHDVEARFRHLEKLWESETTGQFEREHDTPPVRFDSDSDVPDNEQVER